MPILTATPHDDSLDHLAFRLVSPSQDLQVLMECGLELDLNLEVTPGYGIRRVMVLDNVKLLWNNWMIAVDVDA